MTEPPETQEQPVIWDPADCMRAFGFNVPVSYKAKPIEYIDPAPRPFIVQIPLVEYFERMTRWKADPWQVDLCNRLQEAAENRHVKGVRQVYHAEPQIGKTVIISQHLPAWLLGHNPKHRVVLAMYNTAQSEKHSKEVIRILSSPLHKAIFPDPQGWLAGDYGQKENRAVQAAVSGWRTNAGRGDDGNPGNAGQLSFNPVGLVSGLTGSGFDCVPAETLIKTEIGDIRIGDLFVLKYKPKVYAFNHLTNQVELRRIEALRKMPANELIEITTKSGQFIRCTPNHRIWIDGEYQAAEKIQQGSCLSRLQRQNGLDEQEVLGMCVESEATNTESGFYLPTMSGAKRSGECNVSNVFLRGQSCGRSQNVRSLLKALRSPEIRREQAAKTRTNQEFLLQPLPIGISDFAPRTLLLRDVPRRDIYAASVLQYAVCSQAFAKAQAFNNMPRVPRRVSSAQQQDSVLWQVLREQSPFQTNDWQGELAFQARTKLREVVSRDATLDYGAGSSPMRGMSPAAAAPYCREVGHSSQAKQTRYSPHRPYSIPQQSDESSNVVREMSQNPSRLVDDRVTLVRRVRGTSVKVYDLQVEGCGNFFAEQILVHNSLIIDDPYRSEKDAFSPMVNEAIRNFLDFLESRIHLNSNLWMMFHRYAYDDAAAYVLDGGDVQYTRYATECDGDYVHESTGERFTDPLNRSIGEFISPRRGADYYAKVKKNPRVWFSMNQGRPVAEGSEFFIVDRIQVRPSDIASRRKMECTVLVRAYDLAATEKAGDYTVAPLVGMSPDGKTTFFETVREQVESAGRDVLMLKTAERDGHDVVISVPIDPGAAGKTAFFHIEQLLKGYQVVGRSTTGSKEDRARNFAAAVNSGDVEFIDDENLAESAKWIANGKKEMREFLLSAIAHDDFCDSGSDAYNECYERVAKGLVVKNFKPQRNLITWPSFSAKFMLGTDKIPAHWTVYSAIKITPEASKANSAVIVACAPQNSGMPGTLFVVAEYKEFTSDFEAAFDWLDMALDCYCENSEDATIWLHPASEMYSTTIRHKLERPVQIFPKDISAGITELNYYLKPKGTPSPFNAIEESAGLYGLIADEKQLSVATDEYGFYAVRQEAASWAHNDKSEPSAVGSVMDCLRMICWGFRTHATELTREELIEEAMDDTLKLEAIEVMPDGAAKDGTITRRLLEEKRVIATIDTPVRGAWNRGRR